MVLSQANQPPPPPLPRREAPPVAPPTGLLGEFNAAAVADRLKQSARIGTKDGGHELLFRALGTQCRVLVAGPAQTVATCFSAVLTWVANFEAKYSRFLPDSLISRINAAAGREWVVIDPEAERIFALCQELHFLTRGAFDPTALPLIRLWDWKQPRTTLPTEQEIAAARELVGWRQVQRAPGKVFLPRAGMALDLGGMGKEYAVDQVLLLARQLGLASVLVDFGADVRVAGLPPDGRPAWHVGLEDPAKPGTCWCGLAVREGGVATSGDYLRKFELNGVRYGHIVDLRTGKPVANTVRAVSVLAPSCTQAGMLSTAVFALGPEEGLRLLDATPGTAGVIITDHAKHFSRRFHEHIAS